MEPQLGTLTRNTFGKDRVGRVTGTNGRVTWPRGTLNRARYRAALRDS
jgi:hypothetical protein